MQPRLNLKKKDIWADFEDAPEDDVWGEFEDAPDDVASLKVKALDPEQINVNYSAPAAVRLELSGLEKPEDKLAALRKYYPDAKPYEDGNFIMTDPENGEVMLMNQPGWIPDAGDFAELTPVAGEIVGGVVGSVGGAAGGGAVGSAVPVVGTAVGTVGGAIAGAGTGAAAGRDLVQRVINWGFGNDDTRTLSEYAKDKAVDFAMGAAGEGVGRAAIKGASLAARPIQKALAGKADDAAAALGRAQDFADAGISPTVGMITKNPQALVREATMVRDFPQSRLAQAAQGVDDNVGREFDRITTGLASSTNPALKPTTVQSVGEGLIGKADEANRAINAQRDALYKQVDSLVGAKSATTNSNTKTLLETLNAEKKNLGSSAKLNKGGLLDDVIEQAKAASSDLGKGISFSDAQAMRSTIGKLAFDKNTDPFLATRLKSLYESVTKDMAETAKGASDDVYKTWREADAFNASLYGPDSPKSAIKGVAEAQDGESAFKFLTAKIRDGGSRLAAAREQIEKVGGSAEWDQMTASYLQRMGTTLSADGAEAFSGKRFMTEWNKIAPEAKDAMFAGTTRQGYRQDLDRLARIVDIRQNALKTRAKPQDDFVDQGTRLLLNAATGGAAIAGRRMRNAYMDRLLTNPEVVRWMTGIPQAQMTRNGINEHVGLLRRMVRSSAPTVEGRALLEAVESFLEDSGFPNEQAK